MECVSYDMLSKLPSIKIKRTRAINHIDVFLSKYFSKFTTEPFDENKLNNFIENYVRRFSTETIDNIIHKYATYEIHQQCVDHFINILDKFEYVDNAINSTILKDINFKIYIVMLILKRFVVISEISF